MVDFKVSKCLKKKKSEKLFFIIKKINNEIILKKYTYFIYLLQNMYMMYTYCIGIFLYAINYKCYKLLKTLFYILKKRSFT